MADDHASGSESSEPVSRESIHGDRPAADWVQADISRTFELRRDYYKYSIGVATALLAFTISFPPALSEVEASSLVFVAWPALGVAILCGISLHYIWAQFYITWRNFDNRGRRADGQARRKTLTRLRRTLELVQVVALAVGVLGTSIFASLNVGNIALKTIDRSMTPAPLQRSHTGPVTLPGRPSREQIAVC